MTHAQCWAHTRRGFFEAQDVEPEVAAQAKRLHRLTHSKPMTKALVYARDRRIGLQVYLSDADVAIDTNPMRLDVHTPA